jgi:hypothetical protein
MDTTATEVPKSLQALVDAGLLDESDLASAMVEMSAEELETQVSEEIPSWLQELVTEEGEEAVPPEAEVEEEEAPEAEGIVPLEAEVEEEEAPEAEEVVPPEAEAEEEKAPEAEEVVPPEAEAEEEKALEAKEVAPPKAEVEEEEELADKVLADTRIEEMLAGLAEKPRDYPTRLELARLYCAERDWESALTHYERLVAARQFIPTVIDDLQPLADDRDVDLARLHQILGDAYMQENELDKALEMYRLARKALMKR